MNRERSRALTTVREPDPNNAAAPGTTDPRGTHKPTSTTTPTMVRRSAVLPYVRRDDKPASDAHLAAELAAARVAQEPPWEARGTTCWECSSKSLEWQKWAGATHGGCPHGVAGAA